MNFVTGLQQPLSSILDAVTDGITAQDHSGKLIYANAAAARLLGYASPDALLAVPLAELLPRFDTIDAYGHLLPLKQFPAQLVLQGEGSPQMTLRFRLPGTNDEFWFITEAKPVFDERGDVAFVVNSFHDITQLKQSEQFLRRREQELR